MDPIRKMRSPSGRDIRKSSLPGDILFDPDSKELRVVSTVTREKIKITAYETSNFKCLRDDQVKTGIESERYFRDLIPVHVQCEVHMKGFMLARLCERIEACEKSNKSMEGFLEHIAGMLQMNGADPQEMRRRIEVLIAKGSQ